MYVSDYNFSKVKTVYNYLKGYVGTCHKLFVSNRLTFDCTRRAADISIKLFGSIDNSPW